MEWIQHSKKRTGENDHLSSEQIVKHENVTVKRFYILVGGKITMSTKKSYMSLLKEAIAEFDTSDNLEVKGPMLDPILSWDGDGEIPIYKDAASILERYYFNESRDDGVETMGEGSELEAKYQNDKGSASGEAMKNAKGTGTEQAGTSDAGTILASKAEKSKDIAKEDLQREQDEDDDEDAEAVEEKAFDKDSVKAKEYTDESEELDMENAIIEKLISEMEDEDSDDDESEDKEEVEEGKEIMGYTGDDVAPGMQAKDEKKASGPEEDTKGAGTEQAGTGTDAGQVPPRKDMADQMVKPKNYTDENAMIEAALAELESEISEQDEPPSAPDTPEDDEEKDLDVDKEMAKEQAPPPSAVPGGPGPKDKGDDKEDDEGYYSEAFELFKEAIQEEDSLSEWDAAIQESAQNLVKADPDSLTEDLTSREKKFLFGPIQNMFGACASKCGRITIRSQANSCKDMCIAKRDKAIKLARAKAKGQSDKAAAIAKH